MEESVSKIVVILLIIASLFVLYLLYRASGVSLIFRGLFAVAVLIAVGSIIQKMLKLQGGYGLYMIGSKKGLSFINEISKKHRPFWDAMAMWGLTLGFGLLAYPLTKGKIDKRIFAAGIISLVIILFLILPYISYGFQFINLSQIQNAVSSQSSKGPNIMSYLVSATTIVAGFSGSILLSLFANTESILYSFVLFLTNPSLGIAGSGIASQVPGVAPIIPGIDIPLVAGIIALAVLLIVHEFSHGVLARMAKVRLKSIGVLMFGFIPVGGYVEPDEKMVDKLDKEKQTKIFSAGISANFIAMLIFFALMMFVIVYVAPKAYQYKVIVTGTVPNYPANGVLKSGMQILEWNNHTVTNITSLSQASSTDRLNSSIFILTNTGLYKFKPVPDPNNSSRAIIGVSLAYEPIIATTYAKTVYFAYTVFALSMLLNFLVAVVNLLPIPGLDGWRIYCANIKNNRFIRTLGAFIVIMIIINILPWIFYI